uniref:Transposable element Hobo transposase n=1 Tax=Zeugodacus cucurbitae TaxID=28588 RepID=A0A0A1WZI3_ZEUCU
MQMEVLQKIKSGIYQAIDIAGKSDIWGYFRKIVDTSTQESVPYVICSNCDKIFKFGKGASSSNLKKHVCYKRQISEKTASTTIPKKRKRYKRRLSAESDAEPMMKLSLVSVSEQMHEDVLEHCVRYICRDLQSPAAVNGSGFKELARCLVEVGVKLGTVNFTIEHILPQADTIASRLQSLHVSERETFVDNLRPIIERGMCAGTLNIWTNHKQQRSFAILTVHYIDAEWQLQSQILCTTEVEYCEESAAVMQRTAEHIIAAIEAKFDELNLERDLLEKISFATDQGSNMTRALLNRKSNCNTQLLNTILQHAFDKETLQIYAPHVLDLLRKCQNLSGIFTVEECTTDWREMFDTLHRIRESFSAIKDNLEETGVTQDFNGIERNLLERIINFLEPFKNLTTLLEVEKVPTIQLVLLHMHVLKEKLMKLRNEESNHEMRYIIANCLENIFDAEYMPHTIHKIAAFLWPKYKQMRYLNEAQRAEVYELINRELNEMTENTQTASSNDTPAIGGKMRSSLDDDILSKYEDVHFTAHNQPQSQLTAQIEMYQNACYTESNVLHWWKCHGDEFPLLAKLARTYLCIPATSTASERCFSTANRLLEEQSSSLVVGNLDAILFLHSKLN